MPPDTDLLGNPIGDTIAPTSEAKPVQSGSDDVDLLGNPIGDTIAPTSEAKPVQSGSDDVDLLGNPIGDTIAPTSEAKPVQSGSDDVDLLGNPIQPIQRPDASTNIQAAVGTDPAKNAQVYELAKKTNTDPKYVAGNLDTVATASKTPDQTTLDNLPETAPNSSKWMADNPGNAGMVHTQIPEVVQHESAFNALYKIGLNYARNINSSALGLEEFFNPSAATHSDFKSTVDYLDSKIKNTVTPDLDSGWIDDIKTGNVKGMGEKLLSAVPATQNAITSFLTGGPLVTAGIYAVKGAGETYESSKNKNLLTAAGSVGIGAMEGALNLIPLGFMTKGFPILEKVLGPKLAQATMKYATGKWIGSMIAGGATNDIQTLTEATIAKATGVDPHAFDNIGSKLSESTITGILQGPMFLLGEKLVPEINAVKGLDVSKNSPTATKELLDTLQSEGKLTAHIPVEDFNAHAESKGIKPEDMAKDYGPETEKSHEVAQQTKGNVKIQLSDLIAKGVHNGDLQALGSKMNFDNKVEAEGGKTTLESKPEPVEEPKPTIIDHAKNLINTVLTSNNKKEEPQSEEQKAVLEAYKKNGIPTKPPLDMEKEWQKGFDAITAKLEKMKSDGLSEEEKSRVAQTSEWLKAKITDEVSDLPVYRAKDELDSNLMDTKKSAKNVLDGTASPQEQSVFFNAGLRHLGESDPVLVADKILRSDKDYEINDRLKSQMKLLTGDAKNLLNGDVLNRLMHEGKIGEAHAELIAKQGATQLVEKKLKDMVQGVLQSKDRNIKSEIERLGIKTEDLTKTTQEHLDKFEKLQKESIKEASAGAVQTEMKEHIKPVMAEVTRELARQTAIEERVKASNDAAKILQDMPYKDALNYKQHYSAELKAVKMQERARGKNETDEESSKYGKFAGKEYEQYQARLLNHALTTKSIGLRKTINDALRSIEAKTSIVKNPENISYGHVRAIKNILEGFKQMPKTMNLDSVNSARAEEQETKGYSADAITADTGMIKDENGEYKPENFIQLKDRIGRMDQDAGNSISPSIPMDKDFDKLSVSELMSLENTLNVVKSTGIKNRMVQIGGQAIKLDDGIMRLFGELKDTVGFNYGKHKDTQTLIQRLGDRLTNFALNGEFRLPQNISETMGINGKVPFMTEAYDNKLGTMANNVLRENREIIEGASELRDKYFSKAEQKDMGRKRTVKFMDRTITKSEGMNLLAIAGTDTGWQRLQGGYKMTPKDLEDLKDQVLDEKTFKYLNERAGFNDKLFERQAKMTQDVHNYQPEPVDKRAIPTKFGVLEGAYHPLKYDHDSVEYVNKKGVEIGAPNLPLNQFIQDGHLQSRSDIVNIPPRYDDGVYTTHLAATAKYLGFTKELSEINAVLNHPMGQIILKKALGAEKGQGYDNYIQHLNYVVNGEPHSSSSLTNWLMSASRGLRVADVIYHTGSRPQLFPRKLAFDMYTMGNDPDVGYKTALSYLVKASDFGKNGYSKVYKDVISKSEVIRQRHVDSLNTEMYNMNELFKEAHIGKRVAGFMKNAMYFPEKAADRVTTMLWKDTYDKHIGNGEAESDAVAMADYKVAKLTGSGNPAFRPLPLHGELWQTLAPMHTYLTTIMNRAITEGRVKYLMSPQEIRDNPVKDAFFRASIIGRQIYKYGTVPYMIDTGTQNFIQQKDDDKKTKADLVWISALRLLPIAGEKMIAAEDYPTMKEKIINSTPQGDALYHGYESIPAIARLMQGKHMSDKQLKDAFSPVNLVASIPEQLDNIALNLHRDIVQDNFNSFNLDMMRRVTKDVGGPLHRQTKY